MRKRLIIAAMISIVALMTVFVAGCGKAANTSSDDNSSMMEVTDTDAPSSTTSTAQSTTAIGTGSRTVTVTNETGLEITGVALGESDDSTGYSDAWTFSGFSLPDKATGTLSFTPAATDVAGQQYDIKLSTGVDSIIVIRQVALGDIDALTFHFDEGIGYVTYTDPTTGQEVSTQEQANQVAQQDAATSMPSDLMEEEADAGTGTSDEKEP